MNIERALYFFNRSSDL